MDKLVMLKSSRYGLEIHLNPQAEFSKTASGDGTEAEGFDQIF